jgi:Mor family transcriptional regulator
MVKLEVVPGRKGPNDKLVLVYAYGEPLSFSDILFILRHYFQSEESYYPKPQNQGSCYLMKAILEEFSGLPHEEILKRYQLDRKIKKTVVIEKLHEVLE